MKAFVWACVAIVGISATAYYGLNASGFSTEERAASSSVRLK